jgi:hypothetical protein
LHKVDSAVLALIHGSTLIGRLREALNDTSRREEAAEIVRELIDSIILRPSGTGRERTLGIDLQGTSPGFSTLPAKRRGAPTAPLFRISK